MHIKKNIIALMNGLHHCWTKGNVIDEMPVHHIQMHPISTSANRACRLLLNTTKISRQQRGSNQAVLMSATNHIVFEINYAT